MHKHSLSLSLSLPPYPALYPPLIDYELENAVIARAPSTITRDVLLIFSLYLLLAGRINLPSIPGSISASARLHPSSSFTVRLFVFACPRRERE